MSRSVRMLLAPGSAIASLTLALTAMPPDTQAAYVCKTLAATSSADERMVEQMLERTIPAERLVRTLPREVFAPTPPVGRRSEPPRVVPGGEAVLAERPSTPLRKPTSPPGVAPENYGDNPFGSGTNLNTIYHYTDSLVDTELMNDDPYRRAGRFSFRASNNLSYHCSAALIRPSILATAGHCVHQGGDTGPGKPPESIPRFQGWIRAGVYQPARTGGSAPYGSATARYVCTTSNWYNIGSIQRGYDIGLVVLNKRRGTTNEIGAYTGYLGFCVTNCLQPYWYLTQLGYPGNYYAGAYMTQGQHLETNRDNTDYYHGSGMQGGSSGGPHVTNLGSLSDSTPDKGNYASRNILFAVTSWGCVSDIYKIQGASTTSGPSNSNDFKSLFNGACLRARIVHGASACTNLP